MPEELQTRTEHSRSLEDAERYRALDTLRDVGMLIPVSELEVLYGNVANEGGSVASEFGTSSIGSSEDANSRSVIHARGGDREGEHPLWRDHHAEGLQEVVTDDSDATILNLDFDESSLDSEGKERYRQALRALAISATEGSPVGWRERSYAGSFVREMEEAKDDIIFQSDISKLATSADIGEDTALQLAGALNSRRIALRDPSYLVRQLINHSKDIVTNSFEFEGKDQEVPINLEYAQRYLRQAHIIGARQTSPDRSDSSVVLFDLEKVTTAEELEVRRKEAWQKLGGMAVLLGGSMTYEVEQKQPLLRLLEDVYAKPEGLVEAAKLVDGYEGIFNGDTGNWEGFTLAEHTETVLRNFEENYADKIPVELLAPMRLAILSHDIGKTIASTNGEVQNQKDYNIRQANDFLGKLGVDERLKGLILTIIGDGEELAHQIQIRGAGEIEQNLMEMLASSTLRNFYGSDVVRDDQVDGFIEMCKIIQICDGGAYTSMAVTRKNDDDVFHRNSPSFNTSFAQPVGFGKRGIRLRDKGENSAAKDLTPRR